MLKIKSRTQIAAPLFCALAASGCNLLQPASPSVSVTPSPVTICTPSQVVNGITVPGSCTTTTGGNSSPETFSASQLVGTWTIPCYEATPTGPYTVNSFTQTLVFTSSTLTINSLYYSDSYCQSAYYTLQEITTFTMGTTGLQTDAVATTFNYDTTSVKLTPNSAAAATAMNTNSMCSLTGWVSGTAQSVAGDTCAGEAQDTAGVTLYGIIEVSGSSLFFGPSFGTSSSSAPTQIQSGASGYSLQ